ncbi:MAG: hypothetical protein JST12_20990 [Armatimonadetes bacterium]|nr:hypothetical protein [Armatimonadota bacterium]MBS1704152.1 hypothetical protein [Armatimonadota bacterium]MBS1725504.1 hypothetical protein [Armatimonadota bacterium]
MVRKLIIAAAALGAAALSPAPINDARVAQPHHPEQTQEQVAKQQAFNGVTPIVGQVPGYTNDAGQEGDKPRPGMAAASNGEESLVLGSEKADKVGAITTATNRVAQEEKPSKPLWIWGLLLAVGGFLGWKLIQYKIEKSTPIPELSKKMLREISEGKI